MLKFAYLLQNFRKIEELDYVVGTLNLVRVPIWDYSAHARHRHLYVEKILAE